jgi:hypothetical protein
MSIDMTTFMDNMLGYASTWFNALIPVFAIVVGITLGFGLILLVINLIKGALPHG